MAIAASFRSLIAQIEFVFEPASPTEHFSRLTYVQINESPVGAEEHFSKTARRSLFGGGRPRESHTGEHTLGPIGELLTPLGMGHACFPSASRVARADK
jgi:hypothetical protein